MATLESFMAFMVCWIFMAFMVFMELALTLGMATVAAVAQLEKSEMVQGLES